MSKKLTEQVAELKNFMVSSPDSVNFELIELGKKQLSIFSTKDFGVAVKSFEQAIIDLHLEAIIDLAHGGAQLAVETFGLALRHNVNMVRFTVPMNSPIPNNLGKIVCTIEFSTSQNQKGGRVHLAQEDINACIYYLIFRISRHESARRVAKIGQAAS